ncbi:hypothetical protein VE02_03248 [Pseudogymnoascus sp. 03VT05]|nr:hypothetical protein VE02_03248 [Pseudogymnoascus sp. 03VT05]
MDESNNDRRVDILTFLLDLAKPISDGSCILKIFIASRPENNINSRLRIAPHHIKLQEVNKEDIEIVVGEWIERMVLEGECEEETLLEVKKYIMEHSHGVFMWVTLVLKDLEQHIDDGGYSKSSFDTRLRSLSSELGGKDGFYRLMVNSLVEKYSTNQGQQERGRRILAWVTFAQRPISVTELRDALATPTKLEGMELSTYVLDDNRPHQLDNAILSSFGGLAEVRDSHSGPIIQLIHQTAREFLLHEDKLAEPYHLEEVQGDTEIAMTCCRYLSIVFRPYFPPAEADGKLTKAEMMVRHLSETSLLLYTLVNFQAHLDHLGSNNEKIRDEFMNFVELLTKRSISYAHLLLGQWIKALGWPQKIHVDDTSARLCLHVLLLCAVEARQEKVGEILASLRPDLLHIETGKTNAILMKPLHASPPTAISQIIGGWIPFRGGDDEHEAGITLLLNLGADVDLKDPVGRTPISYAAENGQERGLQSLIEHGANVDSQDRAGRTPISYAAGNGHSRCLQLLVQKGANANSKDKAGRTPLSYAAENGQESTIERLLERKDVEFNSEDTTGRTPLSYAAEDGNHRNVGVLLFLFENANINREISKVNSEDKTGRTPLSYATANGHTAVVELLQSHITKYGGNI